MTFLTIKRPDDWHLHLRDGNAMQDVVAHSARQFGRGLVMPNLKPPVTTVGEALSYRSRILAALPLNTQFQPLMSLYLTDRTAIDMVKEAKEEPSILGFKLYPAGATTNSDAGVTNLEVIYPVLAALEKYDVPLQIHGEVTDPSIDIFDRERIFIQEHLEPLVRRFPNLKVVLEHITTKDGAEFVRDSHAGIGATITAHHLLFNRNSLLAGGVRPHFYCLPILKRESHRAALLEAATSGNKQFFLGTDSAPHPRTQKESACGCAGCYTAYSAIELYATAFESVGRLERLEGFASIHGPDFYRLPRNSDAITLQRMPLKIPESIPFGHEELIPLLAGTEVQWRLAQ